MRATKHRVLDIGKPRYSSPFFAEPRYDAMIPSNLLEPEEKQKEAPVQYGPHIVK